MATIIRPGPDDWEIVREIRLRALKDSPDAFGARYDESARQPESLWRDRLAGPNPTYLVLDDDRAVAMGGGFASPDRHDAGFVWGMWTAPQARSRGYGSAILETSVDWIVGIGRTPYLHVTEGNETARAVYLAHGFEPTGEWEPLREGSPLRIEELVLRRG